MRYKINRQRRRAALTLGLSRLLKLLPNEASCAKKTSNRRSIKAFRRSVQTVGYVIVVELLQVTRTCWERARWRQHPRSLVWVCPWTWHRRLRIVDPRSTRRTSFCTVRSCGYRCRCLWHQRQPSAPGPAAAVHSATIGTPSRIWSKNYKNILSFHIKLYELH